MTNGKIYHWKHGWIRLDHAAAMSGPREATKPGKNSSPLAKIHASKASLMGALQTDGGFTYDPKTGGLLEVGKTKGFAVAIPGTEEVIGREKVHGEDVTRDDFAKGAAAVILKHREAIAKGAKVGGWYSPERNEYMVELTQIVPDQDTAVKLGVGRNQEAIFNLGTGETINTGGTGDGPSEFDKINPNVLSTFVAQPTPEELAAAKYYTGPGYGPLNGALRFGTPMTLPVQDKMKKLDSAFAKSLVKEDLTVYRGVQDGSWLPKNLPPGKLIEDRGYVSTAADPAGQYGGNTKMVIHVPKGAHALDLHGNALSHHPEEEELLLPRGTKLRVVSDTETDGKRLIKAEVVI